MFLNSKPFAHYHLHIFYIVLLSVQVITVHCVNFTQYEEIMTKLKEPEVNITDSIWFFPEPEERRHCVQMQCKFICFNGKSSQITEEFYRAMNETALYCERITELRLYNYEFPNNTIQANFLGEFSRRVQLLYVASSHVVDFEAGAFSNGIYEHLDFENLQLSELRKDLFEGISSSFQGLTVIQENSPIATVSPDFMDPVRSQIKYLCLQVGLTAVQNITAGSSLLSNLGYVDFSFNNFRDTINENAFQRLSVVEHLSLAHSNIHFLPEYIFVDFIGTLLYVNLSFNKLVTIQSIFGWRDIPRDLKVQATGNPWECTCALQKEMEHIFAYYTTVLTCDSPQAYHGWSVFDDRICDPAEENGITEVEPPFAPPTSTEHATVGTSTAAQRPPTITYETMPTSETTTAASFNQTTTASYTTTTRTTTVTTTVSSESGGGADIVSLECHSPTSDTTNWQKLKWPSLIFQVRAQASLSVAIRIESDELDDSYALMWFSKVTMQYYKMETNYNEYGLGCYGSVAYTTTVNDLMPDVAYTFCLILKNERTISPFSCKSVHVHSNLQVSYGAWLTHEMRATGISVAVLAIVMFTFLGISLVFLILKRKPTLIKGSKRVALTKGGKDEIVVFPREHTKHSIQQREQILANRPSKRQLKRHDSVESIDSNQSYMNANLYEVIPAYLKLNEAHVQPSSQSAFPPTPFDDELAESYLPPLRTESSTAHLVSYAEIPYRSKRISNDPLPEVPTKASDSMPMDEPAKSDEDDDKVSIYYASMYDSRV